MREHTSIGFALVMVALVSVFPVEGQDDCEGTAVMCMVSAGMQHCSYQKTFSAMIVNVSNVSMNNATCAGALNNPISTRLTFHAYRAITAPPTATCAWLIQLAGLPTPRTCILNLDDGLPVELMEFEVESEEERGEESGE